jgi:hypothetical protein
MMHPKKLRDNQDGLVSMIVAMLIMLLLTLIVIAMSSNARREQQQELDRQLSSDAFYAAESGINDTLDYIHANSAESPVKNDCNLLGPPITTNKIDIDKLPGEQIVEYSCVMYDENPGSLEYTEIKADNSELIPIESTTGVSSLTISWEAAAGGSIAGCSANPPNTFVPNADWPADCGATMLRAELINIQNLSRDALSNNSSLLYIVPRNSAVGGSIFYVGTGKGTQEGNIVSAACEDSPVPTTDIPAPKKCKFTINDIALKADQKLYLRLRSIYDIGGKGSIVSIYGTDLAGAKVRFRNAQIMVDSTGKANDVLKRLQVRVSAVPKYDMDDFAIHTAGNLCKLLQVYPGAGGAPDTGTSVDTTACPLSTP